MNYSLHCFQVDYKTGGAYSSKIPVREKQCKLFTKTKHLKYLLYKTTWLNTNKSGGFFHNRSVGDLGFRYHPT